MVRGDAVNVKIADGNVANRPIDVTLGVTADDTPTTCASWCASA